MQWPGAGTASSPYTIANLTLQGDSYAVFMRNTDIHIRIENCTFISGYCMIDMEGSSNLVIEHNTMIGPDMGIALYMNGSNNNSIFDNIIGSGNYGAYLYQSDHNLIRDNSISGDTCGICLEASSNNTFSGNNITGAVEMGILMDKNSSRNTVQGNAISTSGYYDIEIGGNENTFIGNWINDSYSYGIFINGGHDNLLYTNHLIGNGANALSKGVSLGYDYPQAYDNGQNEWNNDTMGNYWMDWQTPDTNHDGIVDSPYLIQGGNNQDNHPLVLKTIPLLNITIVSPLSPAYINVDNVVVHGTTVDTVSSNLTVTWFNSATQATGTCVGNSTWYAQVPLMGGTNYLTFTMTDSEQNTRSVNITVIDSSAQPLFRGMPSMPIFSNHNSVQKTYEVTDPVPLLNGYIRHWVNDTFHDQVPIDSIVPGNKSFFETHTFDLELGTNTYWVTVNDSAGNSATYTMLMYYEVVPPTLVINSPLENSYQPGNVTVTWTTGDGGSGVANIEYSTDGTTWSALWATSKTLSGLSEGPHTFYVRSTDQAGNFAVKSVTFMVDTTLPSLEILTPTTGALNNTGNVLVSWAASDAGSGMAKLEMSVDGTIWSQVSGTSDTMTGLSDGPQTVYLRATDVTGNVRIASVTFLVDTVAPTIVGKTPAGSGAPPSTMINVTFSEAMNTGSVNMTVAGINGTMSWNGNSVVFTPSSPLAYDTGYSVTVSGKDLAGNQVNATWTFTTLKNEGAIEGVVKDANGAPIANATVTLSNGMTAVTDANGHFVIENVTSGNYTMTMTKDGFVSVTQNVSTSAGVTSQAGTLDLKAAPSGTAAADNGLVIAMVAVLLVVMAAIGVMLVRKRKRKE